MEQEVMQAIIELDRRGCTDKDIGEIAAANRGHVNDVKLGKYSRTGPTGRRIWEAIQRVNAVDPVDFRERKDFWKSAIKAALAESETSQAA